jgi:DNA invertase Pin-like site-specific DNA recombinase
LLHAIRWLGRGDASCLVTTELSRLCPSVAQLGYVVDALDQVGARLVALDPGLDTGSPAGRAIARALVSVSSWERARKAEMTSVARSKGTPMPRTIAPDVRRRIVRMRRVGMTLQAIADELNRDGVPTARGGVTWRPSSVQAALGYKRPGPLAVATVAAQSRRASPPGSTSHPVGEAGGR